MGNCTSVKHQIGEKSGDARQASTSDLTNLQVDVNNENKGKDRTRKTKSGPIPSRKQQKKPKLLSWKDVDLDHMDDMSRAELASVKAMCHMTYI